MATIALAAVGAAVGSAVLPGVAFAGVAVGAAVGRVVGSLVGAYIDNMLFSSSGQTQVVEGPRLTDLNVTSSSEGSPIPRIYGRARIGGQMIWATRYDEVVTRKTSGGGGGGGGGGKGFGGGGGGGDVTQITYDYYANFAVGLCEGKITRVGRIWADGKELKQSNHNFRVYKGKGNQSRDSLISGKQGTDNTPSYRNTAYVVFERMHLVDFGNRIPNLTFEVFRAVDEFEEVVRAVNIIPASGEFAYDTTEVTTEKQLADSNGSFSGVTVAENVHSYLDGTDWTVSTDQLEDTLDNLEASSIIVSWFGNDLRIGNCYIKPGTDDPDKVTSPYQWEVSGLSRSQAHLISNYEGRPSYGGTPADISVLHAIQDTVARGIRCTLYPFILMDIPHGNSLPDPYSSATSQSPYPWRGRITCYPAPDQPGTVDKTAACQTQVDAFIGTAAVSDFSISGETVIYTGPAEFSYRRMILHYAHLCKAAGGVDAFLIGTEMRGCSWLRDSASTYPFVDALVQLATDVKSVVGAGTKVTYAADWSEYFGHQPSDGSNDVYFHLDPLWSNPNVDMIGIDCYWPLSDWRDGLEHLDAQAGTDGIYDIEYLKGNIFGGEGYDWYYASTSDRETQTRTNITDGAGKPWVFRFKDIRNWWSNQHYNRPGGVEGGSSTAWVPESKPFWLTETGCPAVDKGTNQPNVFYDPKSSESLFPYFSNGTRDDYIQRRYVQAMYNFFDPTHEDYVAGSNLTSSVYSGYMVDIANIFVYTWDARPYPQFPFDQNTWGDGPNWQLGHWLTGRLANGPLATVVSAILTDYDFTKFTIDGLSGVIDGYVIERVMSARQALQPLELAFFFDSYESEGKIKFRSRGYRGVTIELNEDDLVEDNAGSDLYSLSRAQETELPERVNVTYFDGDNDYQSGSVESSRQHVQSLRKSTANLPIIMDQQRAKRVADGMLWEAYASREKMSTGLPPSLMSLEPTDVMKLVLNGGRSFDFRINRIADSSIRRIEALSIDTSAYVPAETSVREVILPPPIVIGSAVFYFMDLPLLTNGYNEDAGYIATFKEPWTGGVNLYRSFPGGSYELNSTIIGQSLIGVTNTDFYSGPTYVWDDVTELWVTLSYGELSSSEDIDVLGGANACAVQNADGHWEIFQFAVAELVGENKYKLSRLLRGKRGSEHQMRDPISAGAKFVFFDGSITQPNMNIDDWSTSYDWRYGPRGFSIDHYSYRQESFAFEGIGTKPYSVVHPSITKNGTDFLMNWIRRTRINGDSWDLEEVPLNEFEEKYEIDVYNDSDVVVRTITAYEPNFTYTEAMRIEDYGYDKTNPTLDIYQISEKYGRGYGNKSTLTVTKVIP